MQLHFRTCGHGEPLIVLHGLFGSSDNWHSVSLEMAAQFTVFALDQRNHGRSPHSAEMDYPLMAKDLQEFLAAQDLDRAHLLGHSMGGKTAMQFALLYPHQTHRLVVADIAPRPYSSRHDALFAALLSLDLAAFQTRQQIEQALAASIPDRPLRRFLLKNVTHDPAGGFCWKIGLREIHANYHRLGAAPAGGRPFDHPTLFLRGERSDYLREEDLPAIHRLFPHAKLGTIPRAGHLVHSDNPEAFVRAVLEFLRAS